MSVLECFIFAMVFTSIGYYIGHNIGVDEGILKGRKAVRDYYESRSR